MNSVRAKKAGSQAGLLDGLARTLPSISLRAGCVREIYFFGAIASFAAFATRNFTTVFALI